MSSHAGEAVMQDVSLPLRVPRCGLLHSVVCASGGQYLMLGEPFIRCRHALPHCFTSAAGHAVFCVVPLTLNQ